MNFFTLLAFFAFFVLRIANATGLDNPEIEIRYVGISQNSNRLLFSIRNNTSHTFSYRKYIPTDTIDTAYFEVFRGSWKKFGNLMFMCGTFSDEELHNLERSFSDHTIKPHGELQTSIGMDNSNLKKGEKIKIFLSLQRENGLSTTCPSPEFTVK